MEIISIVLLFVFRLIKIPIIPAAIAMASKLIINKVERIFSNEHEQQS